MEKKPGKAEDSAAKYPSKTHYLKSIYVIVVNSSYDHKNIALWDLWRAQTFQQD